MDTGHLTLIGKYRKKPVVVEVMQFEYNQDSIEELRKWAGDAIGKVGKARHPDAKAEMEIRTLEDGTHFKVKHIATEGDYIIKGVQGEFYACKPRIFEETYERED